jgi:ABC-type glycerol-3-phosphate transport system permease component
MTILRNTKNTKRIINIVLRYLLIFLLLILLLFPIVMLIFTAIKSQGEIISSRNILPQKITFENFFRVMKMQRFRIYLLNTLFVSIVTALLNMVLASLGAYSLSRFSFPGKKMISLSILMTYMFPGVLLIIPLFIIFNKYRLIDSYLSLIIAYTTFSLPFCIWMLKGFFDSLPKELEDAAVIDGCTRLGVLTAVIIPISTPALVAVAAFSFMLAWNDFLFALTFINSDSLRTLSVGLNTLLGRYYFDYGLLTSASIIMILPVLILFLYIQRMIVSGLSAGAVKG